MIFIYHFFIDTLLLLELCTCKLLNEADDIDPQLKLGNTSTSATYKSCFYYPRVFQRKKGDYLLPFAVLQFVGPSVGPSVCPSVRKQFTSISSYTVDARITKPICMIPLCIQMVATYLKFFYIFQF